ncbi:MAG: AMP-binding protein [Acidobacteria bacterium]|nr:AMP-binding protein [Acidobacteriota bacterium]
MRNIRELLEHRVTVDPDKIFLYSEADGRSFSYQAFAEQAARAEVRLIRRGAGKGQTVSLYLPNCPEYLFYYFGCWRLGARAGPIHYSLKSCEVEYILRDSESSVLVTDREGWLRVEPVRSGLQRLQAVIIVDAPIAEGDLGDPARIDASPPESEVIEASEEAIIIYTSGTSGRPKGCLLTHGNLLANARQISEWMAFTSADRLLCVMPLFHMNALAVTTLTPFIAGASMVLPRVFSVSRHWRIISNYRVTSFGSVATMLTMLLESYPQGPPADLDLACLRFAMCGSAPVPVEVMKQFESRFHCPVIEGYGLSESTCRSTFNPPDDRRRLGSVGLPIGNEMKVVDDDDREVPVGVRGEVLLRGENIMKGYFKNWEATARAFCGGWFHTGDIGYRDEAGYYYIVDRKSDLIIRGGENIYPREIDEVLYRHPLVRDAATIGVPDPIYGEAVRSFLVLREGASISETEMIDYCRAHLADFKCPAAIVFLDEMPKGPTGKVLKRDLAARR